MVRYGKQHRIGWTTGVALMISAAFPSLHCSASASSPAEQRVFPATQKLDQKDTLFQALKAAKTETEARKIEDSIWRIWLDQAPDVKTRQLIDKAMSRRDNYDLEGARLLLNQAIELSPNYSEGWNQRAFIHFLQGDLDESLEDADRALELEPRHFGALSGKALILMQQGRMELGQKALRAAVKIHPFLKERHMLIKPKGTDL